MFDVAVDRAVVEYAETVLAKHNFGRRGVADGNAEEQLTGLVGELVVQDLFGYPRTDGSSGPDGGVDLVFQGLTIDVKTKGRNHRPKPEWVNNFSALQARFSTDVLLFCSFNKKMCVLTICGWTLKDLLLRLATLYPEGTLRFREDGSSFPLKTDEYEIQNRDLYQVRSMQQLAHDLHAIAYAQGQTDAPVSAWGITSSARLASKKALDLRFEPFYNVHTCRAVG